MRELFKFEKEFWNNMSISLIEDCGFVVEISDGKIVGLEQRGEEDD